MAKNDAWAVKAQAQEVRMFTGKGEKSCSAMACVVAKERMFQSKC